MYFFFKNQLTILSENLFLPTRSKIPDLSSCVKFSCVTLYNSSLDDVWSFMFLFPSTVHPIDYFHSSFMKRG